MGADVSPSGQPRARALGVPFDGRPGPWNSITDVAGVEVGYVTLIEGDGEHVVGRGPVRTGVTAVLPRGRDGIGSAVPAGWYSLNGNGEMTGTTWIERDRWAEHAGAHHEHPCGGVGAPRRHRLAGRSTGPTSP